MLWVKQKEMDVKRFFKWGILLTFMYCVLSVIYNHFILDWRINYSERRVQESIVKNYKSNEEEFKKLIYYIRKLEINPVSEIEFLSNDKVNAYLNSPFEFDSLENLSTSIDLIPHEIDEEETWQLDFEFLPSGKVRIEYQDTIINTGNWYWNFEGNSEHPHYNKLINYLGISEIELNRLRRLIKGVDCEALSINLDKSFSLRYDGISFCQYEYYIPNKRIESYKNYLNLEEDIFCGLNRFELFCGYVIYNK